MNRMDRLLLVDGCYYLYRSFFAIRDMKNSLGEPINALYGFFKSIRCMLSDIQPKYVAIVWDSGIPKKRVAIQKSYKQNRPRMPKELASQKPLIQELIQLLGLSSISLDNCEADDLIASYVQVAKNLDLELEIVIATKDKDIFQLISDNVRIYQRINKLKDGVYFELLGHEFVYQKWGINVEQLVDFFSLVGDSADNISGINGVGQKTAARWLNKYQSLEGIFLGIQSDKKWSTKITAYKDKILENRLLIHLEKNLSLPLPISDMKIKPISLQITEFLNKHELFLLVQSIEQELTLN